MGTRIPIAVAALLILALVAVGCSTPAATPAPSASPTTKPAPSPTTAPPAAVINLSFSNFTPPGHHLNVNVFDPIAAEIQKRSGGRVKVTVYPSGTLGPANDHYKMVRTGVADIAYFTTSYTEGLFPLSTILQLPFAVPNATIGSQAFWALKKQGFLDKEFADVRMINLHTSSTYQLMFAKAQPKTLADFKGLKVRTSGGYVTDTLKAVGMVTVAMAGDELYVGLQKGTIEGMVNNYAAVGARKFEEVVRTTVEVGVGLATSGVAMNKDTYAKLPKDIQQIVDQVGEESVGWAARGFENGESDGKNILVKAGAQVYPLAPDERAKWVLLSKPIWDKWVVEMTGKGLPGKEIYKYFVDFLKTKGVTLPF